MHCLSVLVLVLFYRVFIDFSQICVLNKEQGIRW